LRRSTDPLFGKHTNFKPPFNVFPRSKMHIVEQAVGDQKTKQELVDKEQSDGAESSLHAMNLESKQ
jgi:hypothetical protein